MDDVRPSPSLAAQTLASAAGSGTARALVRTWWVGVGLLAALAYLSAISTDGVLAPVGGAAFLAGACVVGAVARNASAEAQREGSVRRGSLLRAAGFGAVVHGGMLGAMTVLGGSALLASLLVTAGAVLVVLLRPTTLTAMGVGQGSASPETPVATIARPQRTPSPHELSVPEIVGELHATAREVRVTTDPCRMEELAVRRGALLDSLAARDPQTLAALMDSNDASAQRRSTEGPDGPVPA